MSPFLESQPGIDPFGASELTQHNEVHEDSASDYKHNFRSLFPSTASHEIHDLACVGFGPASLAIAIALHDALQTTTSKSGRVWRPKVCFLEKQREFGWHRGMLIPGSKMQISFIKDLATLRDPTSQFTFLNYLKKHNRLIQFSNLGTFLPTRLEFEDYMRWSSKHFSEVVKYGQEVMSIRPSKSSPEQPTIDMFVVEALDAATGQVCFWRTRHVIVAIGGRSYIPSIFPRRNKRIVHSSQYCGRVSEVLPSPDLTYRIAVVGGGQSAAEIFNDLHTRFPNAQTILICRDRKLRPSDDSPFVNEVFDPDCVDEFFASSAQERAEALQSVRCTNYGVVRLELLEHIYNKIYLQRVTQPDPSQWQHRLETGMEVMEVTEPVENGPLRLIYRHIGFSRRKDSPRTYDCDAVITATGYKRDSHLEMLEELKELGQLRNGAWQVGRDYRLQLDEELVSNDAGIWLQGSNEATHGIADSLLSILAARSGEIVRSIFGRQLGLD